MGAKASVVEEPAPVIQREYITQQVWSPLCGPDVAAKLVSEAAVRPFEAHAGRAERVVGGGSRVWVPRETSTSPPRCL